jgi:ketosteroid isomerase-like protein
VSAHPNASAARDAFDYFARADVAGAVGLLADDAVWHVPGSTTVSGEYRGRDEIAAFLRRTAELTDRTYRVDLLWVVADDDHVAAVYRARGARDRRSLDIEQALLVNLRDGLWADIRAQPFDQAAFDAFWS